MTIRKIKEKEMIELLNELEGPKLEHKSKDFLSKNSKTIAKKICSFINGEGGLLLIGVKNNKPDGLHFKQEDEERITLICRDRLKPPQHVNITTCEVDKNTIAIIEITPSREPVQTDGRYYIRRGSTTDVMTPVEIKRKFKEAEKLYKIIDIKDANNILQKRQANRDIILDEKQKKKQYLTFESFSGPYLPGKNIIYGNLYENYDKKSKLIFITLHNVTIEELTKILAQYYKIFGDNSYDTSRFSIEQRGFNWVGIGPSDFIKTLEDQKNRYKVIREKYGEDIHIHHRESAFFIDEIKDGLFFISCEPNYKLHSEKITIDYCDIGFVFKDQPFSSIINEFFDLIYIEPLIINSNYEEKIITKNLKITKKIPFNVDGYIQSIRSNDDEGHTWVSGVYGKIPKELLKLELNKDIIVNIRHHNWLEDKANYFIDRIKYTKFDLGCFSSAIVSIDVDW